MKIQIPELHPLDVDELDVITFRFAKRMAAGETLASVVSLTCEQAAGEADALASQLLVGAPVVDVENAQVLQRVQGRVDGAIYRLRCVGQLSGINARRITLAAYLPVQRL